MKRRALLLAGYFTLINRFRRQPATGLVLGVAVLAVSWLVTRPEAAGALAAAADHWLMVFVMAVCHGSISVSRRKQHICAEIEGSWVSPLPFQIEAPMRLAFALATQALGAAIVLACIVVSHAWSGYASSDHATWSDVGTTLVALVSGFASGGTLGWLFMPRFKTPVVGSKYAIVRAPRLRWATAPRLEPLSYWAVAQARVLNNPRVTANTMVIVLLSIPMGTPGEVAVAAAAGWMVGLHLVLTLVATVRTAFAAGWWLRPTPLGTGRFMLSLSWRAVVSQAVACAIVAFIAAAMLGPHMANVAVMSLAMWLLLAIGLAFIACATSLR